MHVWGFSDWIHSIFTAQGWQGCFYLCEHKGVVRCILMIIGACYVELITFFLAEKIDVVIVRWGWVPSLHWSVSLQLDNRTTQLPTKSHREWKSQVEFYANLSSKRGEDPTRWFLPLNWSCFVNMVVVVGWFLQNPVSSTPGAPPQSLDNATLSLVNSR